ncbi:STV1 [Symbiodinium pilosum]|uniref:V-type proton ATPase subunit a n=1 Tax=Symbiodinium pilosum TaxID=2952 RepID=A0A812NIM1_SYMPI|nr:STV1 [Symbiodinium pilosum]
MVVIHFSIPSSFPAPEQTTAAGDKFDFSDCLVHQVIETIEFVLGTVSHTASYLRLWALSLAHQQLSSVFFNLILLTGMSMPLPLNILAVYVCFGLWFAVTLAILGGMDVMECFLHTLRLHWVEFQSKFFKADGRAFQPFEHRTILEQYIHG